jgi:hypothetical protein
VLFARRSARSWQRHIRPTLSFSILENGVEFQYKPRLRAEYGFDVSQDFQCGLRFFLRLTRKHDIIPGFVSPNSWYT